MNVGGGLFLTVSPRSCLCPVLAVHWLGILGGSGTSQSLLVSASPTPPQRHVGPPAAYLARDLTVASLG